LKKIRIEDDGEATVVSHASANRFFKGKTETFPVTRFLLELTQHFPPRGSQSDDTGYMLSARRASGLWKTTAVQLRAWLPHIDPSPVAPVFLNRAGARLSRSGVEHRLAVALVTASKRCLSLAGRQISPHTLRHTTAMNLLQSDMDIAVIALWLGHEDPATTNLYVEADLTMKEAALRRVADPAPKPLRFIAPDRLLAFLKAL
jgi:integrase